MNVDSRVSDHAVQDQVTHSPSWGAAAFGPIYAVTLGRAVPFSAVRVSRELLRGH